MEEEAKRPGISECDMVKDALERRLGLKNPYDLLRQVRQTGSMGRPEASEATGAGLKAKLRAKRPD